MDNRDMVDAIRDSISNMGYTVEDTDKGILIKLPLFCSIEAIQKGQKILLKARFGYVAREIGTGILFVVCILLLGITLAKPLEFPLAILVFLMVGGITWDVKRYVITENMITRIHAVIEKLKAT